MCCDDDPNQPGVVITHVVVAAVVGELVSVVMVLNHPGSTSKCFFSEFGHLVEGKKWSQL